MVLCDKLAFDRLVEAWKLKGMCDICELYRPDRVWSASGNSESSESTGLYLLCECINHGSSIWDVENWMDEELGLDSRHYSLWVRGEDDEEWRHCGSLTDDKLPEHTADVGYYEEGDEEVKREPPAGYITYEYCEIAVDPTVWVEYVIDYTRDEGIKPPSPEEGQLTVLAESLDRIEDLLDRILDRADDLLQRMSDGTGGTNRQYQRSFPNPFPPSE